MNIVKKHYTKSQTLKLSIIVLVISAIIVVLCTQITRSLIGNAYMYSAFAFNSGMIQINSNLITDYSDGKSQFDHEWGHIVWRRLNQSEKLKFKKIVLLEKCSTPYTCKEEKLYGRGDTYVEEEYAERYRISKSINIECT